MEDYIKIVLKVIRFEFVKGVLLFQGIYQYLMAVKTVMYLSATQRQDAFLSLA